MKKLLRADVVSLCEALGFKTAAKWNRAKMREKLFQVVDMVAGSEAAVPEDAEDRERLQALLDEIVEAKAEVEVVQTLDEEPPQVEPAQAEPAESVEAKSTELTEVEQAEVSFDKADQDQDQLEEDAVPELRAEKPKRVKSENTGGPSNKGRIYQLWKSEPTTTPEQGVLEVNGAVKISTIKSWMNQWKKGKALPACAKEN